MELWNLRDAIKHNQMTSTILTDSNNVQPCPDALSSSSIDLTTFAVQKMNHALIFHMIIPIPVLASLPSSVGQPNVTEA